MQNSSCSSGKGNPVTLVRFFKWAIPSLFFLIFVVLNYIDSKQLFCRKKFRMTGFEPRTSGVGTDRSSN